jgi:hypothetical protein
MLSYSNNSSDVHRGFGRGRQPCVLPEFKVGTTIPMHEVDQACTDGVIDIFFSTREGPQPPAFAFLLLSRRSPQNENEEVYQARI